MKKRIVVPAILALALVSCTNKELEPVRENEKPEPVISDGSACIKAVLSEELATRTAFEGGSTTKVVWVDGDAINVNGVNSSDISIDGSDASQASFTGFNAQFERASAMKKNTASVPRPAMPSVNARDFQLSVEVVSVKAPNIAPFL